MPLNRFLKYLYIKVVRINDDPHKVALGMAVGVFFGIFPFAGIVIAVIIATAIKANKLASLVGCLITNTWITLITTLFAVKIGAVIFNKDFGQFSEQFSALLKNFSLKALAKFASSDLFLPFFIGFFVVAFLFAVISYFMTRLFLKIFKKVKKRVTKKNSSGD